jgi:hypothetical protein
VVVVVEVVVVVVEVVDVVLVIIFVTVEVVEFVADVELFSTFEGLGEEDVRSSAALEFTIEIRVDNSSVDLV